MQVTLLTSKWCPTCPEAEKVWSEVARQRPIEYQVLDVADKAGRTLVSNLRIKSVPALVVDGKLKAVGVHSLGEALKMVDSAA
ncbi:thioredoxin family protein [Thermithiobacillus tepidarius DSM 3134]|uniref:thioredoxin family protein n=1 Tax=Thermithiobacillus tepidarius TaxID=929 RepID=UPI0004273A70|nr:thioredoxin family protein [Thermithiobacillus tepidarius]